MNTNISFDSINKMKINYIIKDKFNLENSYSVNNVLKNSLNISNRLLHFLIINHLIFLC